jgi:large subunit ribosomal protein L9
MKVLFLEHVVNVWKKGDIKEVKVWYARNMLFPKWLAVEYTKQVEQNHIAKQKKIENNRIELVENKHKIIEKLNNYKLEFKLKSANNNKLFWAVAEKDIISEIKKIFKITLQRKHIDMPDGHIKKLWDHQVFIKLWEKDIAKISIQISNN